MVERTMDPIAKETRGRGKRSTNLTLRESLVQEAKALDINLSLAAEDGIARAVAKARDEQWIERNRGAMASYDAFVEKEGLILGDVRTF
jgi:antitoxin CcdA